MKTISEEYRKLQQELHENPNYGIASTHFAPIVSEIMKGLKIKSLSDYGAGKKRLYESPLTPRLMARGNFFLSNTL